MRVRRPALPAARRRSRRSLTAAERQRRYRERRAAQEPIRRYKTVKIKGRPNLPNLNREWRAAVEELQRLQVAYQQWRDSLPESLAETPTAEKMDQIIDLDDLAAVDPPLGFGRD